jgi:hypothetical protein
MTGERDDWEAAADEARADLKLNAAMLATQCDLARDAEARAADYNRMTFDGSEEETFAQAVEGALNTAARRLGQ